MLLSNWELWGKKDPKRDLSVKPESLVTASLRSTTSEMTGRLDGTMEKSRCWRKVTSGVVNSNGTDLSVLHRVL